MVNWKTRCITSFPLFLVLGFWLYEEFAPERNYGFVFVGLLVPVMAWLSVSEFRRDRRWRAAALALGSVYMAVILARVLGF